MFQGYTLPGANEFLHQYVESSLPHAPPPSLYLSVFSISAPPPRHPSSSPTTAIALPLSKKKKPSLSCSYLPRPPPPCQACLPPSLLPPLQLTRPVANAVLLLLQFMGSLRQPSPVVDGEGRVGRERWDG